MCLPLELMSGTLGTEATTGAYEVDGTVGGRIVDAVLVALVPVGIKSTVGSKLLSKLGA